MRELFFIRDNLANKISYYHLLLFMASLPFDRFYSHVILISFIVHTLIHVKKESFSSIFKGRNMVLASVFLVTVYSTIYALNPAGAYSEWGVQLTILLFPLLFCLVRLDLRKYRSALLLAFSLLCTATVAYLYADVLLAIKYYHLPFSSLFSYAFTHHNFSAPIHMHATYLSMQLAIALIYLLSLLMKEGRLYHRLFYLFCLLILCGGLIQLSSKSVCFCLLLVINFAVPWFLLKGAARWKFILMTVTLSILAVLSIFRLHSFRERYIGELVIDLSPPAKGEIEDSRLARWDAATQLIAQAPLVGHGAGAEVPLLQEVFFNKKLYNSYLHQLNAHNQFLSFLLKSGVAGLLIYLATLLFGFRLSLLRKDLLFFLFMLLITFVSLSENLLDVDKGVIFYAFFFSFFVFSLDKDIVKH